MSMIQSQEATYAVKLREQLEFAGCESRVAAIVSRTIGELIDHVEQTDADMRREVKEVERRAAMKPIHQRTERDALLSRVAAFTVIVMAASITAGVLASIVR